MDYLIDFIHNVLASFLGIIKQKGVTDLVNHIPPILFELNYPNHNVWSTDLVCFYSWRVSRTQERLTKLRFRKIRNRRVQHSTEADWLTLYQHVYDLYDVPYLQIQKTATWCNLSKLRQKFLPVMRGKNWVT